MKQALSDELGERWKGQPYGGMWAKETHWEELLPFRRPGHPVAAAHLPYFFLHEMLTLLFWQTLIYPSRPKGNVTLPL